MARLRNRQDDSWDISRLSLRDIIFLTFDTPLEFPIAGTRIHTLEDYRAAWEQNRSIFLDAGYEREGQPRDEYMRFTPGRRPIGYWLFDLGYTEVPKNQVEELQRRREFLPGEFSAAQKLAKEFGGDFNPAERETLREERRNDI
jgi:hypothetical protein